MPRREPEGEPATGTSLQMAGLSDEVRADLLKAQAESIQSNIALPQVKIMAAGSGLFDFKDSNETPREFEGVILGDHASNVLWDSVYGQDRSEDQNRPACTSNDGKFGVPREGFRHAALGGAAATGVERIDCVTCPYNQWGSKAMIDDRPNTNKRGKAVINQRMVYMMLEGRQLPIEIVLPPTSITAYDEYLSKLLNRGVPVQAVLTRVSQNVVQKGTMRWGVAAFNEGGVLDERLFSAVMSARERFMRIINPSETVTAAAPHDDFEAPDEATGAAAGGDGPNW